MSVFVRGKEGGMKLSRHARLPFALVLGGLVSAAIVMACDTATDGPLAPSLDGAIMTVDGATSDATGHETSTGETDGGAGIIHISAGKFTSCALYGNGTVRCWGDNVNGLHGDGTKSDSVFTASTVSGLNDAVELSTGDAHICVRKKDGTLGCWGTNGYGALGNGLTEGKYYLTPTPAVQASDAGTSPLTNVVGISARQYNHTCVVRTARTVDCFGRNIEAQLGTGNYVDQYAAFTSVVGIADAVSVAISANYGCALRSNGGVWCWGTGYFGELGGTKGTSNVAVAAKNADSSPVTDAVSIDVGYTDMCFIRSAGKVFCYGYNQTGQLATGDKDTTRVSNEIPGIVDAKQVVVGEFHVCALHATGTVSCWGDNSKGQLGDGTDIEKLVPAAVPGLTDAIEISARTFGTCALRASGKVVCWGDNTSGQLGDGTKEARSGLVTVPGLD